MATLDEALLWSFENNKLSIIRPSIVLIPEFNLIQGDITKLDVDIIVNAANSALSGGGGVDGAIHRAAGPRLLEACRVFDRCPAGQAVVTEAFDLPARWVVHAVGPVWYGGDRNEEELLGSCYSAAMGIARSKNAVSIAFPAISCGAYRFPHAKAASVAISALRESSANWPAALNITLCCFDAPVHRAYSQELKQQGLDSV